MAKTAGLGDAFFIGGFDLSGDVSALQTIRASRALLDVTAINKSARERLPGIADGEISANSWWDTADDAMHEALSSMLPTDRIAMYCRGTTLGDPVAMLSGKQIDYNQNRGADGSLAATVQVLGSAGSPLEWGIQLTAGSDTFASAGNGTSVNNGAATTTGAAAYLQVLSLGSGTVDVAIHDSADNSAFALVTGLTFTSATARTAQRKETAVGLDIRQYVRVVTSNTFTNAVIVVGFKRYPDPAA